MPYAFTIDLPVKREFYEEITAEIGPETPKGLIAHLVFEIESGIRFVDVWESKADHDIFMEQRVQPARRRVFERQGMKPPDMPMQEQPLKCADVWTVAYAGRRQTVR